MRDENGGARVAGTVLGLVQAAWIAYPPKALGCLLNQRKPLRRFLEDGRVPIDNNRCERSMRPMAIGRRNWLFAGSVRGGEVAAVIYTLIECCRLVKIDMADYLSDVLVRVATDPASKVAELVPAQGTVTVAATTAATQASPHSQSAHRQGLGNGCRMLTLGS